MTNREIHFALLFFLIGVMTTSVMRLLFIPSAHKKVAGAHTASCTKTHSALELKRLFDNKLAFDYVVKNCKTVEDARLVDLLLNGSYEIVIVTSCPDCTQKEVTIMSDKELLYNAWYKNPRIAIEYITNPSIKNVIAITDSREKTTLAWNRQSSLVTIYDKQKMR